MNSIVKFLLIPIIIIGTNINSNNCYSIEDNNIITNNIPQNNEVITYLDNGPANENATLEQWTKRASFTPIDTYGEKYDNFNMFCEEHNLQQLRDGIIGFLVDIYNLAHALIYSSGNCSSSITDSINEWKNQRTEDDYRLSHLEKQNSYYQCIHINNMKSIIRSAQKKLNPNKYSGNNNLNDISFNTNEPLKLMKCCYYFANQLVQLTHDIVYALNNKVNKYKNKKMSNKEIYKDFKEYLIDEIVNPCYKLLVQAFLLFMNNEDEFVLNNIVLTPNYDETTKEFLHFLKNNCNMKHIKYKFIYNISSLKSELSQKNQEFINELKSNINEIQQNMTNISYQNIKDDLFALTNLSSIKLVLSETNYEDIVSYTDSSCFFIVKDIDNRKITTNNEIINESYNYMKGLAYRTDNMLDNIHNDYLFPLPFNEECDMYYYEIKNLEEKLYKFNGKIHNKDYLSEIKELLERIG